jgi:hypothetical protein
MPKAPVALFVYNRPEHTRRTVEALLGNEGVADTDLFVFSDGPRTPEAAPLVRQVREYVGSLRGFRSLSLVERPSNLGLRASIVDGVTRLCRQRGRVIVLEDDLLCARYFLAYMNLALDRYADAEPVMQIAGCTLPSSFPVPDDAFLLPFVTTWGWGTWDRAWKHYDPEVRGYDRLASDKALRRKFDLQGYFNYFQLLRSQREGRADSWGILWYASVFLRQGLTLYPRKTLVRNIGLDGSGANRFAREVAQAAIGEDFHVLALPEAATVAPYANAFVEGMPRRKLSFGSLLSTIFRSFSR